MLVGASELRETFGGAVPPVLGANVTWTCQYAIHRTSISFSPQLHPVHLISGMRTALYKITTHSHSARGHGWYTLLGSSALIGKN